MYIYIHVSKTLFNRLKVLSSPTNMIVSPKRGDPKKDTKYTTILAMRTSKKVPLTLGNHHLFFLGLGGPTDPSIKAQRRRHGMGL